MVKLAASAVRKIGKRRAMKALAAAATPTS